MADASQDQQIYSDSSLRRFSLKLLRQFFRAGNWRSAIKNSELPEKAQATITALVEQTRLMRFEKSEIADELIAHFVDGLDRGNTCEELTSAFGDPEVAATLFRSSKLRRRPMAIKAGKATFWTALASGAGYLVLMAFFNAASPTPSVDYAALLNQKAAAVPESERAWLAYRDAWTKFKFSEGGSGSHFTEIFQKDEAGKQTSELIRPEDQGWAEAVEKLKASAELLDAFRAGAQLEHLGLALHADLSKYSEKDFKALFPKKDYKAYLADENRNSMGSYTLGENADRLMGDSIISVLLPHVQQFRQATRIFQVDTRLAVTENNPDRVVDDIKVILGFARQQKNESYLVCNLVGVALFKIGVAQIEEVIRENPKFLNQGQLTQLQNAVAKFDFSKIDFSGERAGQLDLLQRVYSDDGSGDGRLTPEGLEILTMLQQWQAAGDNTKDSAGIPWQRQSRLTRSVFGPALMISQPRRQEVANSIEDLIEEAETRSSTPWWEDNLSDLSAETEITSVALLSKALSRIHSSFQVTIAAQDAGLLGMAIERYRLKFDSWPQSMEELKDEFLDRVPLDRVTGEPLIFKASDDGVIVYSVGGDLDDDGGNHNAKAIPLYSTYDDTADGDWVLWPIDRG